MWRDTSLPAKHGEHVKQIRHPVLGTLAFELSAFAVDGRPDLSMLVYNRATDAERAKLGAPVRAARKRRKTRSA